MITIYSYSSCSTCRKALKWLDEHGLDYELIDIVKSPPSKKILRNALLQYADRKRLLNTSGVSYRKLGAQVIKGMGDEELIDSLFSDGKLIKRPLLITSTGVTIVGFRPEEWDKVFCP